MAGELSDASPRTIGGVMAGTLIAVIVSRNIPTVFDKSMKRLWHLHFPSHPHIPQQCTIGCATLLVGRCCSFSFSFSFSFTFPSSFFLIVFPPLWPMWRRVLFRAFCAFQGSLFNGRWYWMGRSVRVGRSSCIIAHSHDGAWCVGIHLVDLADDKTNCLAFYLVGDGSSETKCFLWPC